MERKERAPGLKSGKSGTYGQYGQGMEAVERRRMLAAHVVGDSTVYTTIQAAVDAASPGGIVNVDPGTYQELVRINKAGLTVNGAQAGVDARSPTRSGSGESIVRGEDAGGGIRTSSFYVTADDVTIDGFTVQDTNSPGTFGGGIVPAPDTHGSHILNNIIKNNATGMILANDSASDATVIAHNLFLSNNLPGQHTGRAIYTDGGFTNRALTNVVIDDNTFFDNHGGLPQASLEAAIGIEAQSTSTQTDIALTNNIFDFNGKALLVTNASDMTITGNIVYNTRDTRSGALRFEGNVHDVLISGNTVYAANARGIRIDNVGAPGDNFNFTITGNNIFLNGLNTALGVNHDALFVGIGQFSGQLDARNNWWGAANGPSGDAPGSGDGLFANGNDVAYIPFATAPLDTLQLPFFGKPLPAESTRIDAVNYDRGGEGIAYHDIESANRGGQSAVRPREGVDLEKTTDPGSGFAIDFTRAGEFVEYGVNVAQAGIFDIDFRVANAQATGGKFHVEVDGVDVTGSITVPNTGGWGTYNTITDSGIPLTAGRHVLRVAFDTGGTTDAIGNFNWFKLTRTGALPTPAPAAPTGLAASAATSSQIDLTWTDNANNETGFKLERSTNGVDFTQIATPGANATSFSDTGLSASTKYFYRIRATNAGGDSDFSNVANATTATPTPQSVTYIPTGATWKYLDNGSNQGTAWRATGFNDSTWASGAAELGYGDGDEATVVSFGPNSNAKFITTYFRKSFTVANASQVSALNLRIKRDDGAVVYLNGAEVFRSNMPTGTIGNTTPASSAIEDNTFFTSTVNPALLLSGNNVIAVEIHQANQSSSDISFNFELTATVSQPAVAPAAPSDLAATAAGTSQINLKWADNASNETGFIVERSLDGSTGWTQVGTPAQNATSFSDTLNLQPSTQYFYRVRATNAVGPSGNSNIASATTAATPPSDQTVTYISTGATWNYLDNGSDQGTAWRAGGFDDSSWKSGAAQLGYGDGDEATVVSFGGNPDEKFITTYFRKTFAVADASQVKSLTLRLLRDDGAVVYLNGQEVVRDNIGSGDVSFTRLASRSLEDEEFHTFTLNPALLSSGTNTIAVEIHQGSQSSSDISFDLELKAVVGGVISPGPGALPAPWVTNDVGPVAAAGQASFKNGAFVIVGDGADIWGKSDSFRFVYQPLEGDGEIVARVAAMEKKNLFAKAGIMLRQTLGHDAKQASLFVTPANGLRFIRRGNVGGASTSKVPGDHTKLTAPQWLRLVRGGSTITAYRSADGVTWTLVGSDTVSLSETIFVGLAVTSHQSGVVNSATFDNVSVVG